MAKKDKIEPLPEVEAFDPIQFTAKKARGAVQKFRSMIGHDDELARAIAQIQDAASEGKLSTTFYFAVNATCVDAVISTLSKPEVGYTCQRFNSDPQAPNRAKITIEW